MLPFRYLSGFWIPPCKVLDGLAGGFQLGMKLSETHAQIISYYEEATTKMAYVNIET